MLAELLLRVIVSDMQKAENYGWQVRKASAHCETSNPMGFIRAAIVQIGGRAHFTGTAIPWSDTIANAGAARTGALS